MTTTERPRPEGYPATPELDKQTEIIRSGKAATIQEFLDWLLDECGMTLARWDEETWTEPRLTPWHGGRERLMAEHFGVDLNAVERERQAVLEWVRAQPEAKP
jgi:hypothetical protein